ncbi:MAG: response regulator transcription factor [Bacteroidales bacterium]|nr:response regulator transcription factor [Bacteroidales bacterium]
MNHYILADNQDITRIGLISLVKEVNDRAQIVEAADYSELQSLLRAYPRSVVVVDYSLFNFMSINHFLNMKSGAKESVWLLFSYEPEEYFLRQILLADPTFSVVLKQSSGTQVKDALGSIAAEDVYWCDYAESVMKARFTKEESPGPLTASEKVILREIALGKTTKEIAFKKNLSFHTVNTHRRNIYQKLGVNSMNEATRFALQAGLIDLMEYYI